MREWHLEHAQQRIVKYIAGSASVTISLSKDASEWQKKMYKHEYR